MLPGKAMREREMQLFPISICVPVYNEIAFLERTLQSALSQPVAEVVISDNASTDGSYELALSYSKRYAHIKVTRWTSTVTALKNFIRAIACARQPYSIILGAHDILGPDYAAQMYHAIMSHPGAVLAYADVLYVDKKYEIQGTYSYPDKASLQHENPLARIISLSKHLHDGSMWHGLSRRDVYLSMLEYNFKCKVDFYALGYMLLQGKFVHSENSLYTRMDNHAETLAEQAERYTVLFSQRHKITCPFCWVFRKNYQAALLFLKLLGVGGNDHATLKKYFLSRYCNPCSHTLS